MMKNILKRASFSRIRSFSTRCWAAKYEEHGSASDCVKMVEEPMPQISSHDQVKIRMLAAPMNPADFNMIEGVYSIRPALPAIGGNEGVGEVIEVGKDVSSLKVGDWVIPANPGFGTWRTHAVCSEAELDRVPNDIPVEMAATMAVNPCTALRMLSDFVPLKAGDVLIQNGATSGVGQAIIQLAKARGIKTINILRERPQLQETIDSLKSLGADVVVTDDFACGKGMRDVMASLPKPLLGLNCIGGKTSLEISRMIADGGVMVTYGGMSRQPVQVPTGRLIFNDIQLRGFWLSRWTMTHPKSERMAMLNEIADLIRKRQLQLWIDTKPFNELSDALKLAREGFRKGKVVLKFD